LPGSLFNMFLSWCIGALGVSCRPISLTASRQLQQGCDGGQGGGRSQITCGQSGDDAQCLHRCVLRVQRVCLAVRRGEEQRGERCAMRRGAASGSEVWCSEVRFSESTLRVHAHPLPSHSPPHATAAPRVWWGGGGRKGSGLAQPADNRVPGCLDCWWLPWRSDGHPGV
jgi:hypothetical protein